ncbi:dihydroxyacetone kinase family protein [Raineyella sp.]|uniref:dihydroxyacetone kinase family protein n=1 Tax=Raineyella sp. TaxID=1911550 RepID=UPI002B1E9B14|nr:dihydroxyacetone kinase family protein [Raineyella sp.]MEA5155034.1 dihydroxyacetone kinase family protein [Raineyella sp.]
MRKIINEPTDFVDEFLDGVLLAHPGELVRVGDDQRAVVRVDAGRPGRVGIVTGGGSGHLPLFLGYVGPGLASGCAVGNVFSSPSPRQILAATRASDGGAGVLYLYGNYGGDVYNFDLAAELAGAEGIRTTTVLGRDDVSSAPADRAGTRRGVAGLFFAYKVAGAAAERGDDLAAVTRVAQSACDATRTMGVGLSPTILPAAGEPTFDLPAGQMEVGIGIHGEPGHHRGPLESADAITDRLLAGIVPDLGLTEGDRVAVLVNGLGATPLEELYIVYRRVHAVLGAAGVAVDLAFVGEYATSLEMAGASVSVCVLDDERAGLLAAPAHSPFFGQAAPTGAGSGRSLPADDSHPAAGSRDVRRVPGEALVPLLRSVCAMLPSHEPELRELDAAVGDGDLGITVAAGARAQVAALAAMPDDAHPADVFRTLGSAFASANPSTFAALLGSGLIAGAAAFEDTGRVSAASLRSAVELAMARIADLGHAEVGDKTVLDALDAVRRTLADHAEPDHAGPDPAVLDHAGPGHPEPGHAGPGHPGSAHDLAGACAASVARSIDTAATKAAVHGRAAWLGQRSAGRPDPGSVAVLRSVEDVARAMERLTHV